MTRDRLDQLQQQRERSHATKSSVRKSTATVLTSTLSAAESTVAVRSSKIGIACKSLLLSYYSSRNELSTRESPESQLFQGKCDHNHIFPASSYLTNCVCIRVCEGNLTQPCYDSHLRSARSCPCARTAQQVCCVWGVRGIGRGGEGERIGYRERVSRTVGRVSTCACVLCVCVRCVLFAHTHKCL